MVVCWCSSLGGGGGHNIFPLYVLDSCDLLEYSSSDDIVYCVLVFQGGMGAMGGKY